MFFFSVDTSVDICFQGRDQTFVLDGCERHHTQMSDLAQCLSRQQQGDEPGGSAAHTMSLLLKKRRAMRNQCIIYIEPPSGRQK